MSSTNINVGMFEGRNSSRVLKPPGGGHSQIFGAFEDDKPRPKMRHQNSSEINACFVQHKTETKEVIVAQEVDVQDHQIYQKQENSENTLPDIPMDDSKQQVPPRVRVPPGGFSSGFW